jgi:hypothetical protein
MKNYPSLSSLIVILLTAFLLQNCTKKDETPITPPPGEISIGEFTITPDGIFVNEAAELLVRLIVPANVTLVDSSVKLVRVDNDNKPIGEIGLLFDNGDLSNGDEILGDNVFSGIFSLTETSVGDVKLRVDAKYKEGDQTGDGSTSVKTLKVYSDLTSKEFNDIVNTQTTAADKVSEFLSGNVENMPTAINQTVDWLKSQTEVESAESDGSTSIRIKYKSGLYGGMIVSVEDANGNVHTKGGYVPEGDRRKTKSIPVEKQTTGTYFAPSRTISKAAKFDAELDPKIIGNRNVLIYAPFESYFPVDMRPTLVNILNSTEFEFEITTYTDQNATVSALENMTAYGLVIFDTHGSGGKEFGTGEIVDTNSTAYKDKYKAMLKAGKLAIWKNVTISITGGVKNKKDLYAIRAPFISGLAGKFPNSVIFNGSCESTIAADLQNAFIGKGAKTYYGFNKVVNVTFCALAADSAVKRLAKDLKTTSESFIGGSDPQSPNATFEIKGANDVHYPDDLINGDFEFGKLDGWTKAGDGRVISKLAFVSPTGGNYMGIISTGLGYTTATGSIFQTFTVKNTESTLTVKWNFLSEEFLEYIGSQFQDYFRIIIKTPDGAENILLSKTIDGIAADFGARYNPPDDITPGNLVSVSPGIVFDRGGVYMTDWQTSTFDVTAYRGKRITLILAAGDVGDSIYDTAILLDDISIK